MPYGQWVEMRILICKSLAMLVFLILLIKGYFSSHEDLCDFMSEPLAEFIDSQPNALSLKFQLQNFQPSSDTRRYEVPWVHLLSVARFFAKRVASRECVKERPWQS